ncbi:hypothetical protein FACS1894156_8240 [Bacteroidia bacterium]|nr:hypothetical protein FACS1894156_8240 [Bacteroidia bacterium]
MKKLLFFIVCFLSIGWGVAVVHAQDAVADNTEAAAPVPATATEAAAPAPYAKSSIAEFEEHDPWGIAMTFTAIAVVFSALLLLFLSFKYVGKVMQYLRGRREAVHAPEESKAVDGKTAQQPSDVYAAIAFALHQYQHDIYQMEKAVLTINKVARAYSPW